MRYIKILISILLSEKEVICMDVRMIQDLFFKQIKKQTLGASQSRLRFFSLDQIKKRGVLE